MNILFGDSWKTSLTGYVGAIATALLPVLQGGTFTTRDLLMAAVIAVLGRLAADTGGK